MQLTTNNQYTNNQNCLPMNPYLGDDEIAFITKELLCQY